VNQGSQTRTFVYDSLKRLSSATNPQSGTVSYDYDGNGNLLQTLNWTSPKPAGQAGKHLDASRRRLDASSQRVDMSDRHLDIVGTGVGSPVDT
jgi:YD repeat-containing protein